jgi:hypothetical protein
MSETPRTDAINKEIQGGKSFTFWSTVIIDHARTLERELAAMAAAKELAERQVKLLCGHIDDYGSCWNCPAKTMGAACSHSGESCREQLAAWSRAEAEGGKG